MVLPNVLVCLCSYNKMSGTFISRNFFFTILEAKSPRSRHWQIWFLIWVSLLLRWCLLLCLHMTQEENAIFSSGRGGMAKGRVTAPSNLFHKDANGFMRLCFPDLITSSGPLPLNLITLATKFQYMNFGRQTTAPNKK